MSKLSHWIQLEKTPSSEHPIVFNINMWRSPEQVQQHRIQQLSTAANVLAEQVEVWTYIFPQLIDYLKFRVLVISI